MQRALTLMLLIALGGCDDEPAPRQDGATVARIAAASAMPTPPASQSTKAQPAPALVGADVARAQWTRSDDGKSGEKPRCAPLALASAAGANGVPRAADFSGGWGVAFDLPNLRSAYLPGRACCPMTKSQPRRSATGWRDNGPICKRWTSCPPHPLPDMAYRVRSLILRTIPKAMGCNPLPMSMSGARHAPIMSGAASAARICRLCSAICGYWTDVSLSFLPVA